MDWRNVFSFYVFLIVRNLYFNRGGKMIFLKVWKIIWNSIGLSIEFYEKL